MQLNQRLLNQNATDAIDEDEPYWWFIASISAGLAICGILFMACVCFSDRMGRKIKYTRSYQKKKIEPKSKTRPKVEPRKKQGEPRRVKSAKEARGKPATHSTRRTQSARSNKIDPKSTTQKKSMKGVSRDEYFKRR